MTVNVLCEEVRVRSPPELREEYRRQEILGKPIRIQEHRDSTLHNIMPEDWLRPISRCLHLAVRMVFSPSG